MLGTGTAILDFVEPDLRAPLPGVEITAMVAAALMCGFRLVPSPQVNHEDVLIHPDATRLQQMRDAKAAGMTRLIRFHFLHGQRVLMKLGDRPGADEMGIHVFRDRWRADAAFRRELQAWPKFGEWHDGLRAKLIKQGNRVIGVMEGERLAVARTPNFGGDAATCAAFAEMMDRGSVTE
jgi:hypothetical protein